MYFFLINRQNIAQKKQTICIGFTVNKTIKQCVLSVWNSFAFFFPFFGRPSVTSHDEEGRRLSLLTATAYQPVKIVCTFNYLCCGLDSLLWLTNALRIRGQKIPSVPAKTKNHLCKLCLYYGRSSRTRTVVFIYILCTHMPFRWI